MPRTTATEANELEQALKAAGRDPDLAFDIWDIWQRSGIRAALDELEKPMTSITYNPAHFAPVPYVGAGEPKQEAQTVWHQLDRETWLQVEIRRNPDGYSTRPYVKEAKLMRNLQPNGNWRSSDSYSQWHSLHLEEDVNAAPARAPEPPALDDSIGARYIADKYADSKPQARPDIHEARRKRGMW